MNNNISQNDAQLNKLFESVTADTPDLSRDEILKLITEKQDRKAAPIVPTQKKTVHQLRNGILLMLGILGLATIAYFTFFTPDTEAPTTAPVLENRPAVLPSASSTIDTVDMHAAQLDSDTRQNKASQYRYIAGGSVVPGAGTNQAVIDPKRWEMFVHKPIDLAVFKPIDIDEEKLASLGLLRTDSGEVIYYHNEYKFGFPMHEYIRQFGDDEDPNLKILGMRPFYAQYVTDSRGNMMLHYENKTINGGTSIMVGIFDRDLKEMLKNVKYYGSGTATSIELSIDTVAKLQRRKVVVKQGIMHIDTIITHVLRDEASYRRQVERIVAALRVTDSVYKMSLGGIDAIARDYPFDFSRADDPLVFKINSKFKEIERTSKSELEKLSNKLEEVNALMHDWPKVEGKLRLEQLAIKLSYEAYIEQSKLQAAELANPVDLVAVNIRPATGLKINPKLDNGLIFWYKDSDTLRSILDASTATAKPSTDPKLKLTVMPNPAMLYLYLNYSVEEASPLRLTLADITGKQVYTDVWKAQPEQGSARSTCSNIPPASISWSSIPSEAAQRAR